jgi:hypothetical protein
MMREIRMGQIHEETVSRMDGRDAEEWDERFRHIADMLGFNLSSILSPENRRAE